MRTSGLCMVLAGLFVAGPLFMAGAVAPHVCDPYPIGRCGAYQREELVFCYAAGQPKNVYHVSPTETHVITIGPGNPLKGMDQPTVGGPAPHVFSEDTDTMGLLYVRKTPTEAFLADPWEAPAPSKNVYLEDNAVAGLQSKPFICAVFKWFAECEPAAWMMFSPVPKNADMVLA